MKCSWQAVIAAAVLIGTTATVQAQGLELTVADIVTGEKASLPQTGKWTVDAGQSSGLPAGCVKTLMIDSGALKGLGCLQTVGWAALKELNVVLKKGTDTVTVVFPQTVGKATKTIKLEPCKDDSAHLCMVAKEDIDALQSGNAYYYGSDGWTGFKTQTDADRDRVAINQVGIAYLVDKDVYASIDFKVEGGSDDKESDDGDDDESWCRNDTADFEVICAEFSDDTNRRFLPGTLRRGSVIPPNRSVLVYVRHPRKYSVKIKMEGDRGSTVLAILGDEPSDKGKDRVEASEGEQKIEYLTTSQQLAPRKPGKADLTITLLENGKAQGEPLALELEVEKTYAGALRVGVGTIFGGAINAAYAAQTVSQSGQKEIIATTNNQFDLELTVGYAPFLEFFRGGRGYVGNRNYRFAPYIGVGVLDNENNSLRVLTSLHVGVEYEITPQTSVALTLVGRRVTRLADGLHVGDPVPDGAVLTRSGYQLGFALVFNLSPEFLKVLKKPGQSFFE